RAAQVRVLLAGHHHHAHVELAAGALASPSVDPRILVIQAGTATSWRRRGQPNSFNLVRIDKQTLAVDLMEADDQGAFTCRRSCSYSFAADNGGGWRAYAPLNS